MGHTLILLPIALQVVGMTKFKSMEDVKYYDEECEAHKKLKAYGRDLVEQPWQPPLTVFFEDES